MIAKTLTLRLNGSTLCVRVRFDETAHIEDFERLLTACVLHERAMSGPDAHAAAELYGKAIEALYGLIFGSEWLRVILAWFGEEKREMVSQINPFVIGTVIPAVRRASARQREQAKKAFLKSQKKAVRRK